MDPNVAIGSADTRAQPRLRPARVADLPAVNELIERAVMTWKLPERVKRLAMASYRYDVHDLEHMGVVVAEDSAGNVSGVVACEPAADRDCPEARSGLQVHGIYVDPGQQRHRIGSRLLWAAAVAAREQGYDGVLVKAQADAQGFFAARGMHRLAVVDAGRDYPHRFWLDLARHER